MCGNVPGCKKRAGCLTKSSKSPASIAKSNKQWVGTCLYQEELFGVELRSEADCEYPLDEKSVKKSQMLNTTVTLGFGCVENYATLMMEQKDIVNL